MTALLALLAVGALSWVLRVALITLVPASRLPAGLQDVLDHAVVAIPAALVAGSLVGQGGAAALLVPSPALLALGAAGLVAWRTGHLAATVGVGMAAVWVLDAVWPVG